MLSHDAGPFHYGVSRNHAVCKQRRGITMNWTQVARYGVALLLISITTVGHARLPAAAIASAHPLATEAGFAVLDQGGNAFDAAIAVSAALAVVEPYSSGMGGGGFWLLHEADKQRNIMIDGREKAPGNASRDMYLDNQGKVVHDWAINGPSSAGIPGQPAALAHLAAGYGNLPLSVSLAPAIRLAKEGFPVEEHYRRMALARRNVIRSEEHTSELQSRPHLVCRLLLEKKKPTRPSASHS